MVGCWRSRSERGMQAYHAAGLRMGHLGINQDFDGWKSLLNVRFREKRTLG